MAVVWVRWPFTVDSLPPHRGVSGAAVNEPLMHSAWSALPERGVSWPLDAPPKLGLGHGSLEVLSESRVHVGSSSSSFAELLLLLSRCSQDYCATVEMHWKL